MKKLLLILLCLPFIGLGQSAEDIFWKYKSNLLKTCTDSTINRMKKMEIFPEISSKHNISYEDIALCGCMKLIKKYPTANYMEIDSIGDLEGMSLTWECSNDEYVWDILKAIVTKFGGDDFGNCLIEVIKKNVSLEKISRNYSYYLNIYFEECSELKQ